ncbi:hypothetical protein Tco_0349889, partial [Tanacetum coccineum]
MQTIGEKVNTCKALDASLVNTANSGTESVKQDTNSRSGNDAHADDADIRPIYDEEPMVEAARTMLSASKLPLFFWAEAIATACYTQNRSIIIPTHEKTAYHIINDSLHIFGCTCYLTRDGENLDKMKEKGDS